MGGQMISQVDFNGGVLLTLSIVNFGLSMVSIMMGWRNTLSRILLFFSTLQLITGFLFTLPPYSNNAECYNTVRVEEVFLALVAGGYNLYLYYRVRAVLKRKIEHIFPLFAVVACTLITYCTLVTNKRLCVDGEMVSYTARNNSSLARAFGLLLASGNDLYCLGIFVRRLSASLAFKSNGRIVRLWQVIRNFTLLSVPVAFLAALDTLLVNVTGNKALAQQIIVEILSIARWTPLLLGHVLVCFNRLSGDSVEKMLGLASTSQQTSGTGRKASSVSTKKRPASPGTLDSVISCDVYDGTQDEVIQQDIDIEAQ